MILRNKPMDRRAFARLLAGTLVLGATGALAGCGSGAPVRPSGRAAQLVELAEQGGGEARWFTDSAGRTVAVPFEVNSIVPSGPYAQVLLCTLCPEKLIALSSSFSAKQSVYFPQAVTSLPVYGRYYGKNAAMNYEEVIKAAPDLIIDVGEPSETIGDDLDELQRQTGIPCVYINATLLNMASAYQMLGQLLGVEERGGALARYIADTLALANSNYDEVAERSIRVMYSTGAYGYQAKAKGSVHSQVIDLIGLDNVAQIDNANSTDVSPEQVMLWNPEVLLLSQEMGFYDQIYKDATWSSIKAVRDRRVYEVPYQPYEWLDRPPSVQTVLGIRWLGNLLAPDLYDYDMTECAREFFNLFWNYNLSEDEARALMGNSTF